MALEAELPESLFPVAAHVVHAVPGRIRLRVPALKGARETVHDLVEELSGIPGVVRLTARPSTGTLVVDYEGPVKTVILGLAQSGRIAFETAKAGFPALPISLISRVVATQADGFLAKHTEGVLSSRSALAVALLIVAVGQVFKGNIFGPASTLFMSALALLEETETGRQT